jgi:hypothetical protein
MGKGSKIRIIIIIILVVLIIYTFNKLIYYPSKQVLLPYIYNNRIIEPFKLGDCILLDTSPDITVKNKVFSFSLFVGNLSVFENITEECKNNNKIVMNKNIINWYDKYGYTQYNKFVQLFEDKNWSEYGVIHYISLETAYLPWVEYDSSIEKFVYTDKTFIQHYLELNSKYGNRYKQYIYTSPNFQINKNVTYWNHSTKNVINSTITRPYYGSVVRFLTLIVPNVDVVLFRDAHTTMPNPKTNYDSNWINFWINSTNNKFFMYHSAYYNPTHASGEHAPFAATWAAKRINNNQDSIFNDDEWKSSFGMLKEINNSVWYLKDGYGIDERLFYIILKHYKDSFNNKNFVDNTYFVGITLVLFLFVNPAYPQDYFRYKDNNNFFNFSKHSLETTNPESINITSNNVSSGYYLRKNIHWWVGRNIFNDIRCILLSLLKNYAYSNEVDINSITINQFFNYIESIQKNNTSLSYFEKQQIYLIPSKYHIWEYIFDYETQIIDQPLISYLENSSKISEFSSRNINLKWDILNSCKLTTRTFIGDKLDLYPYNYYESDNQTRKQIPSINDLPNWHPLYNVDKSELYRYTL